MSDLRAAEQELYANMWGSVDDYAKHSPGVAYLPAFLQIIGDKRGSVLDAGCGSGKAGLQLRNLDFDVTLCDLTDEGLVDEARELPFKSACLWHDLHLAAPRTYVLRTPIPFTYVYCCDVMEHIPPQFTMLCVQRMLDVVNEGVFFGISLVPDQFGIWMGRPLHQTVQGFEWWRDCLAELGNVAEARDLLTAGLYYVTPRRGR